MAYLWLALAVLFFAGILTLYPIETEYCHESRNPPRKECANYHVALVSLWRVGEILHTYHGLLTALATLAVAVFTWTLWRSSEKMWRVTKASADAAAKSAAAAERTVGQMEKAAQQQMHNTRMEAGAWIFGSPWWGDINTTNGKVHMLASNHGRTPGLIIRYHMEFRRTPPQDDGPNDPRYDESYVNKTPQVLGAGEKTFQLEHEFEWNGSDMFAVGFIEYEDAFGGKNTTRFCNHFRTQRSAGSRAYNTIRPDKSESYTGLS
jgi:hypothetical protein